MKLLIKYTGQNNSLKGHYIAFDTASTDDYTVLFCYDKNGEIVTLSDFNCEVIDDSTAMLRKLDETL